MFETGDIVYWNVDDPRTKEIVCRINPILNSHRYGVVYQSDRDTTTVLINGDRVIRWTHEFTKVEIE